MLPASTNGNGNGHAKPAKPPPGSFAAVLQETEDLQNMMRDALVFPVKSTDLSPKRCCINPWPPGPQWHPSARAGIRPEH